MQAFLERLWRPWRELKRFAASPAEHRALVFYSEGAGSWRHFRGVIQELLDTTSLTVSYVTSDAADVALTEAGPRTPVYYVGRGGAMAAFFQSLAAQVVIMTVPDLQTFHIKRSRSVGRYVYLHHSMVSTHMIYRKAAFDHFDSILCVGPHHVEETRQWEHLQGLPAKALVPHGYGLLDDIIQQAGALPPGRAGKTVLVAPSWGPQGLLETQALPVCKALLDDGHRVVVRPHPRTVQLAPRLLPELQQAIGDRHDFAIDLDREGWTSLAEADVMISDWSGVAFEYAFGLLRPVIFLDTARKVNNSEYGRIHAVPFEVRTRGAIGDVVPNKAWDRLRAAVSHCLDEDPAGRGSRLRTAREESIYHVGSSAAVAARYLAGLLQ
jgi:hypothetical protein